MAAGTRCPECTATLEASRGSRHDRGYGTEHEAQRRRLLRAVADAERRLAPLTCGICGQPLHTWQALEAAHTTPLRIAPGGLPDAMQHEQCNPRGTSPANYAPQ